MTKNPYDVLGVSRNASEDEIKRAYREQSRKYHPDANVDNPLAELAEEKFKEIQEAYDAIMKEREAGYGGYGYGSAQSSTYAGQQSGEMQSVFNCINSGRYREALNTLDTMQNRNAQWYYASAFAHSRMGNNVLARDHAAQAVNMEPGNTQYQQLYNQLNWNSQRYQNNPYGGGYGNRNAGGCGTGNFCCDLCLVDSLCECMGGDICSCM